MLADIQILSFCDWDPVVDWWWSLAPFVTLDKVMDRHIGSRVSLPCLRVSSCVFTFVQSCGFVPISTGRLDVGRHSLA